MAKKVSTCLDGCGRSILCFSLLALLNVACWMIYAGQSALLSEETKTITVSTVVAAAEAAAAAVAEDLANLSKPIPDWRKRHCGEASLGGSGAHQRVGEVYMIFVQGSSYIMGALATAISIRATGTLRPLVCSWVDVEPWAIQLLVEACDVVEPLGLFQWPRYAKTNWTEAPRDLWATFNELEFWRMTNYSRILKLDIDMMVLQNIDELFDLPRGRVAGSLDPLMWWGQLKDHPREQKKYLNTGLMLFEPSVKAYEEMKEALVYEKVPMFAGEQMLIAKYFENHFVTLPRTYNVAVCCQPEWAGRDHASRAKVVHFMRTTKPWKVDPVNREKGPKPHGIGTGEYKFDLEAYWKFHGMWMKFGKIIKMQEQRPTGVDWAQLCAVMPVPKDVEIVPPPRSFLFQPRSQSLQDIKAAAEAEEKRPRDKAREGKGRRTEAEAEAPKEKGKGKGRGGRGRGKGKGKGAEQEMAPQTSKRGVDVDDQMLADEKLTEMASQTSKSEAQPAKAKYDYGYDYKSYYDYDYSGI